MGRKYGPKDSQFADLQGVRQEDAAAAPSNKWVSALLDIVKLTNQARLYWERKPSAEGQQAFEATFNGKTLQFRVLPAFSNAEQGPGGINRHLALQLFIIGQNGIYDTAFPSIPALTAVENAVMRQVNAREENILNELHEAAKAAA